MQRSIRSPVALGALALVGDVAEAQVLSNTATVTLNATQQATLTVTVSTPSVSVPSINVGTTNFPAVNVTTDWNLVSAGHPAAGRLVRHPDGGPLPTAPTTSRRRACAVRSMVARILPSAAPRSTRSAWPAVRCPSSPRPSGPASVPARTRSTCSSTSPPPPPAGAYTGTLNLRAIVQ